jgi:hypothetical protein
MIDEGQAPRHYFHERPLIKKKIATYLESPRQNWAELAIGLRRDRLVQWFGDISYTLVSTPYSNDWKNWVVLLHESGN